MSLGVNFINVLRSSFLYKIVVPKITKPNVTRELLYDALNRILLFWEKNTQILNSSFEDERKKKWIKSNIFLPRKFL